jgi:hypothetical protein
MAARKLPAAMGAIVSRAANEGGHHSKVVVDADDERTGCTTRPVKTAEAPSSSFRSGRPS